MEPLGTSRTSGIANNLNDVTFGNNIFVEMGASGNIVRSFDNGTTFDNATSSRGWTLYRVGI